MLMVATLTADEKYIARTILQFFTLLRVSPESGRRILEALAHDAAMSVEDIRREALSITRPTSE